MRKPALEVQVGIPEQKGFLKGAHSPDEYREPEEQDVKVEHILELPPKAAPLTPYPEPPITSVRTSMTDRWLGAIW